MIYVLMECIIDSETLVRGVALTRRAAEEWESENLYVDDDQKTFRLFYCFTPIDEIG